MKGEQMDLLAWKPAVAEIVPFPCAARTGDIRRVATTMDTKHGKDAERYWKRTVSRMRDEMVAAHLPASVIARELRRFHDAVEFEMVKLAYTVQPGGDAA